MRLYQIGKEPIWHRGGPYSGSAYQQEHERLEQHFAVPAFCSFTSYKSSLFD